DVRGRRRRAEEGPRRRRVARASTRAHQADRRRVREVARRRRAHLLPSDPLTAAVGYYRNHWDALTRFIDDAQVPIDNSPTEREFQNFAKLRLNMLFAGSTEGAHRACVLLGLLATCRALGGPVRACRAWAF